MPQESDLTERVRDPLAPHRATPAELQALIAAQRTGQPYLALRGVDQELMLHSLDPAVGRLTVGRRAANTVCVAWDDEVSGVHAELVATSDEWVVVDEGLSTNGTFINGERVRGRRRLRDGDRLRIGRTLIAFHTGGPSDVTPTVMGAESDVPLDLTPAQLRVLSALCRPYDDARVAAPATNDQIAKELIVTEHAVKRHLQNLFKLFNIDQLPQNEKRAKLAALALHHGLVTTSRDQ